MMDMFHMFLKRFGVARLSRLASALKMTLVFVYVDVSCSDVVRVSQVGHSK